MTRLLFFATLVLSLAIGTVVSSQTVTLVDGWTVDGTYANQNKNFNVSGGIDRIVVVTLSAEKSNGALMDVTAVMLGDQVLTELLDFTVGNSGAYHSLHWVGYLLENEIAARVGDGLTISYGNAPNNPSGEPKIHYASYENVDQTNPIADSSSNSNTNTSSLQLSSSLSVGTGDKVIGFSVTGQPNSLAVSTSGYTEETQSIGGSNDHASAVYHRTATTATTTDPTFTVSSSHRLAVSGFVLNAASAPLPTITSVTPSSGISTAGRP